MTFCYCGDFLHASTWVYKGLIQNLYWKIPLSWEGGSLGSGVWSALMITVVLLPCEGSGQASCASAQRGLSSIFCNVTSCPLY